MTISEAAAAWAGAKEALGKAQLDFETAREANNQAARTEAEAWAELQKLSGRVDVRTPPPQESPWQPLEQKRDSTDYESRFERNKRGNGVVG